LRAAVLHKPFDMRLEEVPVPRFGPEEVLVRVRAVGVCGSDVDYYATGRCGNFTVREPLILGHESSGEIARVGSRVEGLRVGDRVAIEPGFPCRRCRFCREGRYNLCPDVRFYGTPPVDGAFAEYAAAPADSVFKLPENMTFEEGAMVEPLSVGIQASKRGSIGPGKSAVVFGAGPIGLVTLQAARASGATEVYAVDLADYRLRYAEKFGATGVINAREGDPLERIGELTGGRGVDVAFDAAGSVETAQQAVRAVGRGGVAVIISMLPSPEFPIRMTDLVEKEMDLRGVFRYANTYPTAIGLVSRGVVDVRSLVTHRFPLDQVQRAFDVAEKRLEDALKVVVTP